MRTARTRGPHKKHPDEDVDRAIGDLWHSPLAFATKTFWKVRACSNSMALAQEMEPLSFGDAQVGFHLQGPSLVVHIAPSKGLRRFWCRSGMPGARDEALSACGCCCCCCCLQHFFHTRHSSPLPGGACPACRLGFASCACPPHIIASLADEKQLIVEVDVSSVVLQWATPLLCHMSAPLSFTPPLWSNGMIAQAAQGDFRAMSTPQRVWQVGSEKAQREHAAVGAQEAALIGAVS